MNSPSGQIGRVVGVASTKLRIQLDPAATGLTKVSSDGISTVGAVNSYVVIPAGPHRVVAIVTAVRIFGERSAATPTGTESQYELDAIVTGRFEGKSFKSGLAGYPPLHAPVFCANAAEIRQIFIPSGGPALRIGTSAVVPEQDVSLDANLLLAHHTVIVGSTGSGKSCTVAAILEGLLEMDVPGAHIIVFDINGEYAKCFDSTESCKVAKYVVGPTPGAESGLILPHWFMNNEENLSLFRASEGVQAPILQRAIADARMTDAEHAAHFLHLRVLTDTANQLEALLSDRNPQPKIMKQLRSLFRFSQERAGETGELQEIWQNIREACGAAGTALALDQEWTPLSAEERNTLGAFLLQVRVEARSGYNALGLGSAKASSDFDAPLYYSLERLCDTFLPQRIALEQQTDPKVAAYVSTMQMRLSRLLADGRYDFMTRVPSHDQPLATFLRALLGVDPTRGQGADSDWPAKDAHLAQAVTGDPAPSLTILDLSLIASDVLEAVTALLGRLIFDFAVRSEPRASNPVLLVLEEAHRFVPNDTTAVGARSAAVFSRIAKEGRKFGVGLILASQRPSELSETVVAQCGTVIAHRLTHEADQRLLRHATPFVSHDLLEQLPGLAQQHALITGVATAVPAAVRVRDVVTPPRSNDPDYIDVWRSPVEKEELGAFIDRVAADWEGGPRPGPAQPPEADQPTDAPAPGAAPLDATD